ncbi:MAG: Rrf2 family transcriptional regulator [Elusimicrobia bacterium]|nr:Rrf2 family transcriptional regulator [Elusimicrobiota bacterium]
MRFLFLSPASRYALLGLRVLALAAGRPRPADEVARKGGLPANTLSKIFQRLARRGLLRAERGPGGGYSLAKPAAETTAADILRAVQDIVPGGHHCLLNNRLCGKQGFCPVHQVIIRADRIVIAGFEALTLEHLADSEGWT